MVTATTNFLSAVLHLQRVYQNDQRLREIARESRRYYKKREIDSLNELEKYEFLFSNHHRKLTESAGLVVYPGIGLSETSQIYISCIIAGKSFQETYQEIGKSFDRIIREVQNDPTRSRGLIEAYEKELIQVYNDFGTGCVDLIRANFGDPSTTSKEIDTFQAELMQSVRKMLNKQVPKFWEAGISWAEINLEKAKKKEADVYIPPNQDAVDALIERNLGFIKGMSEDQKKSILSELTEGMLRGEGIDQLVKRLAPYVDAGSGKGQSRAEMIARSEVMYGLNQGTLTRYKRDSISKVQWLAGPDDRMCVICGQKNGSIYDIEKAPSLPYHPNCRCCWTPYFETAGEFLDNWQKKYGAEEIEHCGVYDEEGNLLSESTGDSGSVSPTGDVTDKIVIHNHPTGPADLSNADLKYAFSHNLKTIIAVNPNGERVSITRPSGGWPPVDSVDVAWKETVTESQSYYRTIRANIKAGVIDEATGLKRLNDEMQPILYKKLGVVAVRS